MKNHKIRRLKGRFTNHKTIIPSLYFFLLNKCTNLKIESSDFVLHSDLLDLYALSTKLKLLKIKWCDEVILERPYWNTRCIFYLGNKYFFSEYFNVTISFSYFINYYENTQKNIFDVKKNIKLLTECNLRKQIDLLSIT